MIIDTCSSRERILHTKKIPVLSQDGEPQYVLGISEDITDRIQAEETLRKSEATLRSIFRAAPIGIGMVKDRILTEEGRRMAEDRHDFMTQFFARFLEEHNGER